MAAPEARVTKLQFMLGMGSTSAGEEKSRFASSKSETPRLTRLFPHFSQLQKALKNWIRHLFVSGLEILIPRAFLCRQKFRKKLRSEEGWIRTCDPCVPSRALYHGAEAAHKIAQRSAKDWWYIHKNDVLEYDQFKSLFKERFWNSAIQRQTRRKVEFGIFDAGGKLDRVTYATTIFGYAKELELTDSDEELAERLADHFEKGIRHAFTGQQVKSKSTLFLILTDYYNMIKERKVENPIANKIKAR